MGYDTPLEIGFQGSLFTYSIDSDFMVVLVYVDDLILTGSNPKMCSTFKACQRSHIKDLGQLKYSLGIKGAVTT